MRVWVLYLILGILAVVVGALAVFNPAVTSIAIEIFIAWAFIIFGIATVVMGFANNRGASLFWSIMLGILMVVTGVVLLRNPAAGVGAMGMILAILSLGTGIMMIVATFTPSLGNYRWLSFIGGLASLLLAWLIFASPALSIGILFGCQLIVDGVGMAVFAMSVRDLRRSF